MCAYLYIYVYSTYIYMYIIYIYYIYIIYNIYIYNIYIIYICLDKRGNKNTHNLPFCIRAELSHSRNVRNRHDLANGLMTPEGHVNLWL